MRIGEVTAFYNKNSNQRKKEQKREKQIVALDHALPNSKRISDIISISETALHLEELDRDRRLVENRILNTPESSRYLEKFRHDYSRGNYDLNTAIQKILEESRILLI
jgi:hypothetical protein